MLAAPPLDLTARGGFTGKTNACWAGAQAARGAWLLFTDADTIHEPGDLSRAIHEAEKSQRRAALLLAAPDRHRLLAARGHAAGLLRARQRLSAEAGQRSRLRSLAAANGQFLLVEREAYFSVGGHRAVGREILEDVALARNIKRATAPSASATLPRPSPPACTAPLPEMIEGWTKNLALLFPSPIALALWRILELLLFFGLPILALGIAWLVPWQRCGTPAVSGSEPSGASTPASRAPTFLPLDVAISILGVPLFVYLLVRSVIHHRIRKRVAWKGRSYNINAAEPAYHR